MFRFGPFTLNARTRALTCGESTAHLPAKQFDLLLLLVSNHERVVTKAEIREALWDGRVVEDGNLKQAVFSLRQTLAGLDAETRYIVTVSGKGYRFAAPVLAETAGAGEVAATASPAPRSDRWRMAAAATVVAMLIGAGLWAVFGYRDGPRDVVFAAFENRTGDPAFDHVADTLISLDLSETAWLNVLPESRIATILARMRAPAGSSLSPATAGEVCKRINGGVVIDGALSRLGDHFLLTAKATDCLTGRVLAAGRDVFAGREQTPAATDRVARILRMGLGESYWAIARSRMPRGEHLTTASFEALSAYCEGLYLARTGRIVEQKPLLEKAVAIDPTFANGWAALADYKANTGDMAGASAAITRANALRSTVSEREALYIDVDYSDYVLHDPWAAVRSLRAWLMFHDADGWAWCDLGNELEETGRFDEAIDPDQRCVMSSHYDEGSFANLMDALAHAGRIGQARQAAARARREGMASSPTRRRDADLAFVQGDSKVMADLVADVRDKPSEPWVLYDAVEMSLARGQVHAAVALEDRAAAAALRAGGEVFNQPLFAVETIELGYPEIGAPRVAALKDDADPSMLGYAIALAGPPARAQRLLDARLSTGGRDPMLLNFDAPRVRAALLARRGQLAEALGQFATAEDLRGVNFAMDYQHGLLALQAGRPAEAAAAFRDITANPGRDPVSPRLPLAHLGLARALTQLGDPKGAHAEYQALFALWAQADPDLRPLLAARMEDERLRSAPGFRR